MGKWSTYQRRGTPTRNAHNCPSVSAPTATVFTDVGGAVNWTIAAPVDVPAGWFLIATQSDTGYDSGAIIQSIPIADAPLIGSADSGDGHYFRFYAAANADGSGCNSDNLDELAAP